MRGRGILIYIHIRIQRECSHLPAHSPYSKCPRHPELDWGQGMSPGGETTDTLQCTVLLSYDVYKLGILNALKLGIYLKGRKGERVSGRELTSLNACNNQDWGSVKL